MRKNTDETLLTLIRDTIKAYEQEVEQEFPVTKVLNYLEGEKEKRLERFLVRRLGHLLDADFHKFLELFNEATKVKKARA